MTTLPAAQGQGSSSRPSWGEILLVVLIAAGALLTLSEFLAIKPGSWTVANDVLFDADISSYRKSLAGPERVRPSPLHPLVVFVWQPIGRATATALRAAGAGDASEFLGARAVVAAFAAVGFGSLWALAASLGVRPLPRVALGAVGLLASSNLMACVPETYGISLGMLSASAAVIWSGMDPNRKAAWLVAMTVLCAGATITNGLYPAVALLWLFLKSPESGGLRPPWLAGSRLRHLAIGGAVAGLLAAGLVAAALPMLGRRFPNVRTHLLGWLHFRIYFDPARTALDWGMGLVYPIVAPYPIRGTDRINFGPNFQAGWTPAHVVAAAAWVVLLVLGLSSGLRDRQTRLFTAGLAGWIGFNFAIHSVWGGFDNFLYTPHWSWALLAIACLAARAPRPWGVVAACLAIAPAQWMTLRWMASTISGG